MAMFAAQPTQEHPCQHGRVETIRLGSLVFPRDRNAAGMDDVHLDAVLGQPTRQPKSVTPGLEGDSDARDGATLADCFVAPTVQQAQ